MDIQKEVWKKTPLAPDHVEVSNVGRVRTKDRTATGIRNGKQITQVRRGKIISPWIDRNGYSLVAIRIDGKRTKYFVHRLVASAFCDSFFPGATVNHIDGIKQNNRATNLEWVSLARNTELQWESGLVNLRGENHPFHKITADQARNIRKCMNYGISPTVLARAIGVSVSLLYKIKDGVRWSSV